MTEPVAFFMACPFGLGGDDIRRASPAFLALAHVEPDLLTLGEGGVAVHPNLGVMDENVLSAAVRRDESEAFLFVKPFHCSCTHNKTPYAPIRA